MKLLKVFPYICILIIIISCIVGCDRNASIIQDEGEVGNGHLFETESSLGMTETPIATAPEQSGTCEESNLYDDSTENITGTTVKENSNESVTSNQQSQEDKQTTEHAQQTMRVTEASTQALQAEPLTGMSEPETMPASQQSTHTTEPTTQTPTAQTTTTVPNQTMYVVESSTEETTTVYVCPHKNITCLGRCLDCDNTPEFVDELMSTIIESSDLYLMEYLKNIYRSSMSNDFNSSNLSAWDIYTATRLEIAGGALITDYATLAKAMSYTHSLYYIGFSKDTAYEVDFEWFKNNESLEALYSSPSKYKNLESIASRINTYTKTEDAALDVEKMINLKTLVNYSSADDLSYIPRLGQLEDLSVPYTDSSSTWANINSCTHLSSLYLNVLGVSSTGDAEKALQYLAANKSIKKLRLYAPNVDYFDFSKIMDVEMLKEVEIMSFSQLSVEKQKEIIAELPGIIVYFRIIS